MRFVACSMSGDKDPWNHDPRNLMEIRQMTTTASESARLLELRDRNVARGVGGIFYDHLECADQPEWERNFAFTRDVGDAFLDVFPRLVRKRMGQEFSETEKQAQLEWRGRYVEFNLVYDRGTLFGLRTGGNIDAILMSLPPEVKWS